MTSPAKYLLVATLVLQYSGALAEQDTDIVSVWGTASEIDGILEEQEWGNVTPYVGKLTLAFGKSNDLFVYVMNDEEFLYFAIEFETRKFHSNEAVFITLDQRFLGKYYEGQDILGLGVYFNGSQVYYDHVRTQKPPCNQKAFRPKVHCAFEDSRVDGTIDGTGTYRFHEQTAVYEFMKPLKSEDQDFDVQLEHGQIVGLNVALSASSANYSEVYIPGPTPMDNLIVKIVGNPHQHTE